LDLYYFPPQKDSNSTSGNIITENHLITIFANDRDSEADVGSSPNALESEPDEINITVNYVSYHKPIDDCLHPSSDG